MVDFFWSFLSEECNREEEKCDIFFFFPGIVHGGVTEYWRKEQTLQTVHFFPTNHLLAIRGPSPKGHGEGFSPSGSSRVAVKRINQAVRIFSGLQVGWDFKTAREHCPNFKITPKI